MTLEARYAALTNVCLTCVDAAQAVKAALPFQEKRGVVLIDPAFEVTNESERVQRMLAQGLKRMAQACFLIWYPVTTQAFADSLCAALRFVGARGALRAELLVRPTVEQGGLAGSGLVVVNPPWVLHDELKVVLPALAKALAENDQASSRLEWLQQPT